MVASATPSQEAPLRDEVARRLGAPSNLYASEASGLWAYAQAAWLDNPLPALLKERLIVHLSRSCPARYCLVRHVGFLLGEGLLAGDATATALDLPEVLRLLRRPAPDADTLDEIVARLAREPEARALPPSGSEAEAELLDVLAAMFLAPSRSARLGAAVRQAYGAQRFDQFTQLMAFVRAAHHWTELHAGIDIEPDMLARMSAHPELEALLRDSRGAIDAAENMQLRQALHELERAGGAVQETEAAVGLVAGIAQATWEANSAGRPVSDSPSWRAYTGQSREEWLASGGLGAIHPDDREQADQAWREAVARGSGMNAEFRLWHAASRSYRWTNVRAAPVRLEDGQITKWLGMNLDIHERREAETRLREREADLARVQRIGEVGGVDIDVAGGMRSSRSPEYLRLHGLTEKNREETHDQWVARLHPDDRDRAQRILMQALAGPGNSYDSEYRIVRPSDGKVRWIHARADVERDAQGRAVRLVGAHLDVTERREFEDRQRVLVAELQHRTRNLLGVVRAMADKTVRSSVSLKDFRHRFSDRLDALGRVQGLLSRLNEHDRVAFDELIRTELSAMAGLTSRVVLEGPAGVRLRSSTVQMLAMGLHELATNAVKYGALGQPAARLVIRWTFEAEGEQGKPWLHIDWRESRVVMPAPGEAPRGTGQGRELVERALPYQLNARTSFVLGEDGLHCRISLPVSETLPDGAEAP